MVSAIDFRIRPPLHALRTAKMFAEPERTASFTRSLGFEPAPSFLTSSLDLLLKEMDAADIGLGVIPVRTAAGAMGNFSNADIAELVHGDGRRFLGFAAASSELPVDERLDVLAEAMNDPGFRGVVLEPGYEANPVHLDHESLDPVLTFCTLRRWPVILLAGGNAGPDLSYTDPVRLDRLLIRYPDCRFVAAHGGWPWVHQVLHLALRRPNLWVSPDMYLFNMPGAQDYVAAANGFLRDRFLYASSYPFVPADHARWVFEKLGFSSTVVPLLLRENAARLLDL